MKQTNIFKGGVFWHAFRSTLWVLAVTLASAGCQMGPDADQPLASGLEFETRIPMSFTVAESGPPQGAVWEQAYSKVTEALQSAESWEVADAALPALLAEMPPVERSFAEQIAALYMLRSPWLTSEDAPSDRVAFYVKALHDHNSPEAGVIASALPRTMGTWDHSRRTLVARQALDNALAYNARHARKREKSNADVSDLPPEVVQRMNAIRDARNRNLNLRENGIDRLRQLLESEG